MLAQGARVAALAGLIRAAAARRDMLWVPRPLSDKNKTKTKPGNIE
jgi:hypothetical protein